MPFLNENTAAGIAKNAVLQVGKSDSDSGKTVEKGLGVPFAASPLGSYVYFDCAVGVMLDSGIVVHNRLPQVNNTADTLAALNLDSQALETLTPQFGVNLKSNDQYQDIVQRMGHSRYWFRIWGQALRLGFQVPIPGIKMIGSVPAIPYDRNPQWAFNRIFSGCNYGGVLLWHAEWSLWYTTAVPPTNNYVPAADPSAQVIGAPPNLPSNMQAMFSPKDDNAVATSTLVAQQRKRNQ